MAETSIKISLELADKAAQKALSDFIDKSEKADKSFKRTGDSGSSAFAQIGVNIAKASGVYDIFVGNLAANLATEAINSIASAASALFNTFVVEGVHAAQEQEDATNSLNVALAQTGIYSKETSKEIEDYATTLQNTTGVADEVILKNAALIQSIAQLDKDGLKRATASALDLSAALGKDLGTVSEALAKAANGNTTALQKMGLTIEKGRSNAETFANALAAVEDRFAGSAISKVNTFSGAVSILSTSFGDFQEEIGNTIVKNPVFIAAMKEGAKIIQELTAIAKEAGPGIAQFLGQSFLIVNDALAVTITTFDAFARITTSVWRTMETQVLGAALAVAKALSYVGLSSQETVDTLQEQLNEKTSQVFKSFSEDTGLGAAATAVIRIGDAAEDGFGRLKAGAETTIEPLNNTTASVKELTEAQRAAQERLRSFVEDLIKSGESSKATADLQLEAARTKAEGEIAIDQKLADDRIIAQSDFLTRKAEVDAAYESERIAIELEKYTADQARLQAALDAKKASETEYNTARGVLDAKYEQTKLKGEAEFNKKRQKSAKEIRDAEEKENQYRLQSTSTMFGGLAALAATGGKKMFEIAKAFNLAEAITSGILSIQMAAASAPPPANIPAIIGATAFAAANVIRISSTKAPSFENGGIVGGNSFTGDRVAANVNSGEMILNRSQQSELYKIANGQNSDGTDIRAIVTTIAREFATQPIVVNIDGREVFGVIRNGLNSGRSFV